MNYTYSDELYHYGVLGMKWGVRRGRSKGTGYQYQSWGTKHNRKLAAKMDKKLSKGDELSKEKRAKYELKKAQYEHRAKRSAELDKREQRYAERVSAGKNIALRLLTSAGYGDIGIGSKPYQQYMAMLNARDTIEDGKDITDRALSYIGSLAGGRAGSSIVKAVYIRGGEPGHTKKKH